MKKVLSLIAIAAVSATFVACGPSAEEIEAAKKKTEDSIRIADSTANAAAAAQLAEQAKADSIAKAEMMKADSARIADSIAAATKGGKKK
ncbi:MAG TPA: hypothetical protein VGF30_09770 [Bacteroidia bacterium]